MNIKNFIKKIQDCGIPIFLLQDPIKKEPSSTFTFFIISNVLCSVNPEKYIEFMLACAAAYLGRAVVGSKNNVTVSKE